MKRVLVGFIMDGNSGGIDKYLLNYLEVVHNENIRIDFLTNKIHKDLRKRIRECGGELYEIPRLRQPIRQYFKVRQIIKRGVYDAVYLNISTSIDCIVAVAAKHANVKRRVIHSHSSGIDNEKYIERKILYLIHKICRLFLWQYATHYCGCSEKAGEWLFPAKIVKSHKYRTIFNAIEKARFEYNKKTREEVRKELGLKGEFVIGHVGNFCYQKNHAFLLKIFCQLLRMKPEARLLLVGDGSSYEYIQMMAKQKGIDSKIIFLGRRRDTERLYQAMDVFVLPSHFEGMPIVGIEAQAAGLPCVMSDEITKEVKITEECVFVSLKKSAKDWAKIIEDQQKPREAASYLAVAEHYDIEKQREQFMQICEGDR